MKLVYALFLKTHLLSTEVADNSGKDFKKGNLIVLIKLLFSNSFLYNYLRPTQTLIRVICSKCNNVVKLDT